MPQLIDFPEANTDFAPPPDLEESQCFTARAFLGTVEGGSCEGALQVVTCHEFSREEILALCENGGRVYLSTLGGLPPHFLTLSFAEARNVA